MKRRPRKIDPFDQSLKAKGVNGEMSFYEIGEVFGIKAEVAYLIYQTALRKLRRFENRFVWWEARDITLELNEMSRRNEMSLKNKFRTIYRERDFL
ncbi:MAG: hypothetical protein K5978_04535 [Campylobacter sp.]|nr:hypothetical protein [Campylobacter sp.]